MLEMRDKKATGDDNVPADVLRLLGENGLKLMMQLINSIYVTEVAQRFHLDHNDFLKEEAQSYKMQQPLDDRSRRTYSKDGGENTLKNN
jgi:hypothetical protein